MAATHPPTRRPRNRTRKTTTRTRRRSPRRLPRLSWWWPVIALTVIAVAKSWPVYTTVAVALLAGYLILRAVRPARLRGLFDRVDATTSAVNARRRALPATGRTLAAFQHMHHDHFERAIADLAREHPAVLRAAKCGQTADRGLDVLVELHDGRRILIQCKHYRPGNNVGGPAVREIVGSVIANGCHFGAIVTTADFTAEAYATNGILGPSALALVNGSSLVQWANGGRPPWR